MHTVGTICSRILSAMMAALALPAAAFAQCPSKEAATAALQVFAQGEKIEVVKVGPAPIKGLCEAEVKSDRGTGIIFTDSEAKMLINGEIFFDVKKVGPAPIKGLYEVQFKTRRGLGVAYTDGEAKALVRGDILEVGTRRNLTQEHLEVLNAFSAVDMEKVAALTALTLGTKGPVVYLATDPL